MNKKNRYTIEEFSSVDLLVPGKKGNFIAEVSYKLIVRKWFERTLAISGDDKQEEWIIKSLEKFFLHYKGLSCSILSEMKEVRITPENPALVVTYNGSANEVAVCRISGEKIISIKKNW